MVRRLMGVTVVAAMCLLTNVAEAQMPSHSVLGTWKFNVERSVWTPGPRAPADAYEIRQYSDLGNGWYRYVSTGRNNAGNPTFQIGVFKLDGQRYPVHNLATLSTQMTGGRESNLTRSYRVIDDNTVEITTYTDGVAGSPLMRQLSADGMTFIQVGEGTNAQGVQFRNLTVYDRVN